MKYRTSLQGKFAKIVLIRTLNPLNYIIGISFCQ